MQAGPLFDGLLGLSKGAWRMLTEVLFQADRVVVELTTASFQGKRRIASSRLGRTL